MRRGVRVAAALVTAGALVFGMAQSAVADDDLSHKKTQLQSQLAANQKQQDALASSLEDMTGQLAQTQSDLQTIQAKIPAAQQKLETASAALDQAQRAQQQIAGELADAQSQQTAMTQQIADSQAQEQQLRAAVGEMAREAYRDGGGVSELAVALDAQSIDGFIESTQLLATAQRTQQAVFTQLAQAEANAKNQSARLAAVRQQVIQLKAAADQQVLDANTAQQAAVAAKSALDSLLQQQETKQASIQSQIAVAKQQDAELQASTTQIQTQIQQVIKEEQAQAAAAAAAAKKKVVLPSTAAPAKALPNAWFSNPTATNPMYVTSEFGMRMQPVLHIYRLHAGIDLRDGCNQPVYAGRNGTVVWTEYLNGYGNQVMLNHGFVDGKSLMSSYSHLNRYVVAPGQQVTAGQVLGYAGMTGGDSTGCHLHFEVHINGTPVNPRPYLGL